METNNKSKKISEFRALNSLIPMGSNNSNTWFLAAFYNQNNNTYSNIAISLDAITNYCNSYTSYHISYFDKLLENQKYDIKDILNSYLDNMSYQIVDVPISYITSYCATYTSYIISNEVQKISNNMVNLVSKIKNTNSNSSYLIDNSKKISELTSRETITYHKNHSWIPLAQYDSRINAYVNLAINLETITSYCNSYTSYHISYFDKLLENQKYEIKDILNSYLNNMSYQIVDVPISYITSYCATYTSYIISNEVQKISNNMVNLVNKIKNTNSNSSYLRSNSKKISELTARETITYHKDHSWIPLAQYDSRINAYVNLAMNLDTITSYCNSYSSYINTYNSYILDNKITYLQEHIEGSVSNNIISYAFSYSKDYFEWQFL